MWRFVMVLVVFGIGVQVAEAFTVTTYTPAAQYEVQTIDTYSAYEQIILGELIDAPIMYEVASDEPFTLSLTLRAVPVDPVPPFGLLVIRVLEPRGVEEVARVQAATWAEVTDRISGLPYRVGPAYEAELPAGRYQIEVSTPENLGKFMLVMGEGDDGASYRATLASLRALYDFYDEPLIMMIRSPYVYYPLGILLLGVIFGRALWRRRQQIMQRFFHD